MSPATSRSTLAVEARRRSTPPRCGCAALFGELAFEVHDVVAEGDLVVIHNTMSGRHTGVFTVHGPNGEITQAMPPTGRRFATTQTHWMRVKDGKVIEHWANRDDRGTAMQLEWVPPSPWYLVKMALAPRRPRKHAAPANGTSDTVLRTK